MVSREKSLCNSRDREKSGTMAAKKAAEFDSTCALLSFRAMLVAKASL
jgi:hypothetical protein